MAEVTNYDDVAKASPEIVDAEKMRAITRDFYDGQEKVWDATTDYLPLLEGEDTQSKWGYVARLKRSRIVPYVSRAVQFAEGQVFQKPVKFGEDVPVEIRGQEANEEDGTKQVVGWMENIDLQGRNGTRFFRDRFRDLLRSGCAIWLADTPPGDANLPKGEDKRRPYLVGYHSSSLLEDRYQFTETGRKRLEHVRLAETAWEVDPKNRFRKVKVERVRVYDSPAEGQVFLTVYVKSGDHYVIDPKNDLRPIANLVDIPVVIAGDPHGVGIFHHLAHLTACLYRKESDRSNFEHVACVPQGFIGGLSVEEKELLKLGFVRAVDRTMLFSSDAKPGFWEPQGGALDHIRQSIVELKAEIEAESIRSMTDRQSGDVTATESVLNAGQAISRLQAEWLSFADCIELSLQFMAQLAQAKNAKTKEVDGGKVDRERTWQDLRPDAVKLEWVKFLMEKGALSKEGAFEIAKRERAIPEDRDFETEQERIASEGEPMGMMGEGPRVLARARELMAQGVPSDEAMARAEAELQDMAPMDVTSPISGNEKTSKRASAYSVGDEVMVRHGKDHAGAGKGEAGTVEIISTPALGIKFPNMEVHKWYVDEEVEPA